MVDLTAHEKSVLQDFLGQRWAEFVEFAEDFDMTEEECDDLANKLDH